MGTVGSHTLPFIEITRTYGSPSLPSIRFPQSLIGNTKNLRGFTPPETYG